MNCEGYRYILLACTFGALCSSRSRLLSIHWPMLLLPSGRLGPLSELTLYIKACVSCHSRSAAPSCKCCISFRLMPLTASSKRNTHREPPNIPKKTVTPGSLSYLKKIPHYICQAQRLWPPTGFRFPFLSSHEVPLASCMFLQYGDINLTRSCHPLVSLSGLCLKVIFSPRPPFDHPA